MVCVSCSLVSYGGKGSDPTPVQPNTPPAGSGNLFSVDLGSRLQNIGDSEISNGVILVRIAAGNNAPSFTAVQSACTHKGTTIGFNTGQGNFICPLHGSEFSKTGPVLLGPAAMALHKYTVVIDKSTLTVSA